MATNETELAGAAPEGATVFALDHFAQSYIDDPVPTWARLRETEGPWSPTYGGFHILARYADVVAAASDPGTFTSSQGVNIPPMPLPPFIPLEVDPPDHREYRRILNPHFSPEVAVRQEPDVRQLAVDLLSRLEGRAEGDLAEEFAIPFPKAVAMRLVGFPEADLVKIDNWVEHIVGDSKEREGAADLAMEFFMYVTEFIAQRRAEATKDDLVGALLEARYHDEPLSEEQLIPMLLLLLFGGLHTTTSAIAGMLLWLADHPAERELLRTRRDMIPAAVDEFIRYTTPVNQMGRTARAESELGGCPIHVGDKVMLSWGSANHDAAEFDRADEVVLDRSPNRHVAFGIGPHRCVGSHLAKTMVRVALEESLDRLGDYAVADRTKLRYTGGEARGLRSLPVTLSGVR